MPELITFLINLDDSTKRLSEASEQLNAARIPFVRQPAFDGRGQAIDSFPQYDGDASVRFYGRQMTGGELGCYFSHLQCARAFLDTEAAYALVLEDDVRVLDGSAEVLAQLQAWIPENLPSGWDMINLGKASKKIKSKIACFDHAGESYELERAYYFPVTTTAILWSREGAERFIATGHHIFAPLDHFMRRWLSISGRGLAMQPALFETTGAVSDLDKENGGNARKRVPRTATYFVREFRRQSVNYVCATWHLSRHLIGGS